MKKSVLAVTAVLVLSVSGIALAQMDKDKGMMDDKGMGMGMMKEGMMGKKDMMHGMMKMMMEKTVVATSDGGIVIVSANKISKYDKDLNLVKEVELKAPTMEEMQKMCPMMGKGGMMGGEMMGDMDKDDDRASESKESAEEEKVEHLK
jgi:hypothetical protein